MSVGRRTLSLVLGAAMVAGGVWVWDHQRAGGDAQAAASSAPTTGTASVVRRDMHGTQQVSGTLGYGDSSQVTNRKQGTITWLPEEGTVVRRGQALYEVDDLPVPLIYGNLPFWRNLSSGVDDGRDVAQLERNLAALGYDPGTVDDHFSSATREALEDWQEDLGYDRTGTFTPGDAVLAPSAVRVGQLQAKLGSPAAPGQAVMDVTATTRRVAVDLNTDNIADVKVGDRVQVTLPGGGTTAGKVTEIGKVAEASQDGNQDGGGQGDTETTVPLTISLDHPGDSGDLDQAPVDVDITTETHRRVLAVPVNALLALAEGGYAVEVVRADSSRRLVGVRLGLFTDGLVEVRANGNGLAPGMKVVVPQ